MDMRRRDIEQWLMSERAGADDAAEGAFARIVQALPRIEPRADFVDRVGRAVWLAEQHRRRAAQRARLTVGLLVTCAGLAIGIAAIDYLGLWIAEAVASLTSRGVVGFLALLHTAVKSWSLVARIGADVGTVVAMPANTMALLTIELIGLLGVFGLRRLLHHEPGTRSSLEART